MTAKTDSILNTLWQQAAATPAGPARIHFEEAARIIVCLRNNLRCMRTIIDEAQSHTFEETLGELDFAAENTQRACGFIQ